MGKFSMIGRTGGLLAGLSLGALIAASAAFAADGDATVLAAAQTLPKKIELKAPETVTRQIVIEAAKVDAAEIAVKTEDKKIIVPVVAAVAEEKKIILADAPGAGDDAAKIEAPVLSEEVTPAKKVIKKIIVKKLKPKIVEQQVAETVIEDQSYATEYVSQNQSYDSSDGYQAESSGCNQ